MTTTDKKKEKRGLGLAAVFRHPVDSMPASQHDSMSARQQDSEETSQYADIPAAPLTDKKVKATYYLDPLLVKKLKFLAVEKNKDLSALVGEAIQDLLAKAER